MVDFDSTNLEFDSSLPIKTYAPPIAREFSDLAAFLHDDLRINKHKSGAIDNGYDRSPSSYQRMVLSSAPMWYSELYWQHNHIERRKVRINSNLRNGSRNREKRSFRKVIIGPIRRPRVIPALARIRDQTDLSTSLHSLLREFIFEELTNPKHNNFPVQDYFGLIIEEPHAKVPIEYYEKDLMFYNNPAVCK